ncbi:Ig-like domain-containing protein, partial [Neobacillus niacini]|uniref:Ig-like domain-containing protein n=1 Tax=Neobacillus niacini TaxID=86668 RepID=UPI002FFDC8EC
MLITFNSIRVFANEETLLPKGYIDTPKNGSSVKGEIDISGWFLDLSGVSKIEILIDGKSMGEARYGDIRTDVAKVYPEYENANSGYKFTLNTKNLINGQHTLTVKETGN